MISIFDARSMVNVFSYYGRESLYVTSLTFNQAPSDQGARLRKEKKMKNDPEGEELN